MMVRARRGEEPSRICAIRRRLRPRGGWVAGETRAAGHAPETEGDRVGVVQCGRPGERDSPATPSTPVSAARSVRAAEVR
jgi:hypothetical protein